MNFFCKTRARIDLYIGLDLKLASKADIIGDALKLPFRANSFDTVLLIQVLEHIPKPKKMLEEIYRVLKKGGYLVLTCPLTWNLHEEPYDYFRYTCYGLKYLCEWVGFNVLMIKPRTGKWGAIGQMLCNAIYFSGGKRVLIKISLCALISLVFYHLDKINEDPMLSLGYLLIAEK